MPLYEYVATVGGKIVGRVSLPIPVNDRDKVAFTRSAIPNSISIAGSAEAKMVNPTIRALHRMEQKSGNTSDFYRRLGHAPEAVKQAWAAPAIT